MSLYEFHVLIAPETEGCMETTREMLANTASWRKTVTLTTTGVATRQPMWTTTLTCDSDTEARELGRELEATPDCVRVKVERLGREPGDVDGNEYLEAHMKVDLCGVPYENLARTCLAEGVQLLVNPLSEKPLPVTTMRDYNTTQAEFLQRHEELKAAVEALGCAVYKEHIERGVLDTNPATDEGWLFPMGGSVSEKITKVDSSERLRDPRE